MANTLITTRAKRASDHTPVNFGQVCRPAYIGSLVMNTSEKAQKWLQDRGYLTNATTMPDLEDDTILRRKMDLAEPWLDRDGNLVDAPAHPPSCFGLPRMMAMFRRPPFGYRSRCESCRVATDCVKIVDARLCIGGRQAFRNVRDKGVQPYTEEYVDLAAISIVQGWEEQLKEICDRKKREYPERNRQRSRERYRRDREQLLASQGRTPAPKAAPVEQIVEAIGPARLAFRMQGVSETLDELVRNGAAADHRVRRALTDKRGILESVWIAEHAVQAAHPEGKVSTTDLIKAYQHVSGDTRAMSAIRRSVTSAQTQLGRLREVSKGL